MNRVKSYYGIACGLILTLSLLTQSMFSQAKTQATSAKPTVVLVHGAFAEAASWNKVIPLLEQDGFNVVAVHLPLSSLADDVAATRRVLEAQPGPVVLVGHSWGGVVITEAGNSPNVSALVYVSAFMPSEGESAGALLKPFPAAPGVAHPIVDSAGFLRLSKDDIQKYFAPDVKAWESSLIADTQAPIRGSNFAEAVSVAAWKSKPAWLVASSEDQMINPALYPAEAEKTHATLITLKSSHVSPLSHPKEVAEVIIKAAAAQAK